MGRAYQAAENLTAETRGDRGFAMRLGRKCKYGVRALVAVEVAGERCPCGAAQIAGEAQMPGAIAEQILGEFRHTGSLEGRRGPGGGFRPAVAAEEVSVLDVVEALDGEPRTSEPASSPESPAAVLRVWEEALLALKEAFSAHTRDRGAREGVHTRESDHKTGGIVTGRGDRRGKGEAHLRVRL